MTPLKFDKLEFTRPPADPNGARLVLEGSLETILEALERTGNGLGRVVPAESGTYRRFSEPERKPLIMAPMEIGEEDDHE